MHHAPSVTYPVGRSRFLGSALLSIWLASGAVVAAWTAQAAGPDWRQAGGLLAWLVAGAMAAHAWWRSPRGALEWDGGTWHFASCEAAGPRVALDLQHALLLHLLVEGRPLWVWASRTGAPSYWDALRRAVYSRANTAAPQGAKQPVDSP